MILISFNFLILSGFFSAILAEKRPLSTFIENFFLFFGSKKVFREYNFRKKKVKKELEDK
jgi:hypothetical protein